MTSDTALALLMALRVKGRASGEIAAAVAGIPLGDATPSLLALAAVGLVDVKNERFVVTSDGDTELRRLLAREAFDRAALAAVYDDFIVLDARLKAAVTAWQLAGTRGGVVPADGMTTPRTAPATASLDDVRDVAGEARRLAARLATVTSRYAAYVRRLEAACAGLAAGDARFVASPAVDSLHQVWFELHEDLLLTLGREREA